MRNITLIVGSAPDAIEAEDWEKTFFTNIIAINNAWKLNICWNYLIHPEDFPIESRPSTVGHKQKIVQAADYLPELNKFGGCLYQGATMAFTAAYWALGALKPDVLLFKACDMIYSRTGRTHFYGQGAADPLRNDITLESLTAKSYRLSYFAAQQSCSCYNLSTLPHSELTFPRLSLSELNKIQPFYPKSPNAAAALEAEKKLGYYVPSGRYWDELEKFLPQELKKIDDLWCA